VVSIYNLQPASTSNQHARYRPVFGLLGVALTSSAEFEIALAFAFEDPGHFHWAFFYQRALPAPCLFQANSVSCTWFADQWAHGPRCVLRG